MKKPIRRIRKIRKSNAKCAFCEAKTTPDYKNTAELARYITERGKIVGRVHTGICQKHQRRLATSIKRSRHLALLPFTPKV